MKVELQKVETPGREERVLSCPKCPGKLGSYRFMEFVLDRCESCERIWLYKGKLEGAFEKSGTRSAGSLS